MAAIMLQAVDLGVVAADHLFEAPTLGPVEMTASSSTHP